MADTPPDAKTAATDQNGPTAGAKKTTADGSTPNEKTPLPRRKKKKQKRDKQRSAPERIVGPDPDPWPEQVDGAALLRDIAATIKKHLSLPPLAAELLSLWGVATHGAKSTPIFPRLLLTSIDAACGKSLVLEVLSGFCFRPAPADDMTPAVIFRLVDVIKPTLLLDEADTWLHEDFRGLLNSGYKRNGCVWRCDGDDHEPRRFATYAPTAIARIGMPGRMFGPLLTRSIVIRMSRILPSERPEPYSAESRSHLLIFARKAQRWLRDLKLMDPQPNMPAELKHRDADNWRFIFAIASAAGGEWPATVRQIATHFTNNTPTASNVDRRGLLGAVKSILKGWPHDRIRTVELCEKLGQMDDFELARQFRNLSERKAGRLLRKSFGEFPEIPPPRKIRVDGGVYQGYPTAPFLEMFERYAIKSPEEEDLDTEH